MNAPQEFGPFCFLGVCGQAPNDPVLSFPQSLHRQKRTMNNPFEAVAECSPPAGIPDALQRAHLSRDTLEVERVIGRGQFGEVWREIVKMPSPAWVCYRCCRRVVGLLFIVSFLFPGLFGATAGTDWAPADKPTRRTIQAAPEV